MKQSRQEDLHAAVTATLQMESYRIAGSTPAWIANIHAEEETLPTPDQTTTTDIGIGVVGEPPKRGDHIMELLETLLRRLEWLKVSKAKQLLTQRDLLPTKLSGETVDVCEALDKSISSHYLPRGTVICRKRGREDYYTGDVLQECYRIWETIDPQLWGPTVWGWL